MSDGLQLALIIVLITALYFVSSRWRPEGGRQHAMRVSYRIGLAVAALIAVLLAISRLRHG